jgi:2-keto-4-pentenoate hydratase/2-oxohepta-3-ene-1,7-dioic acid hydratase in catechol pathway
MKFVGFAGASGARLGVVEGDRVVDLQAIDPRIPSDLGELLARESGDLRGIGERAHKAPAAARLALADIRYALPVARPGKIICLGLNYLEHVKEGTNKVPDFPTIFMRCRTSLAPHLSALLRPMVSEQFDYEAELVAVIGRRGKHIKAADALSYVAGYSCFNEGSVRNFQRRTTQWDMGKNFDRSGGFGPWMVTADELPPGGKGLRIQSRINGEVLQDDNTKNMMFPVAETIADVSQAMTLEPGDILVTGTPSGVGYPRTPPKWMKEGDTVEVEIEGVGTLRNSVENERPA